MTDKPRIGELSRGAREFVRENRAYLIDYARPVFPFMVIGEALHYMGEAYSRGLTVAGIIITSLFSSCFVMAWHRASLLGPKREFGVNPLNLGPAERHFVVTFFLLVLLMMLFFVIGFLPAIGVAAVTHSIGLSVILAFVTLIGVTILSLRFTFVLPARSVNADLSWREAWRISKGLTGRMLVASLRTNIWLILLTLAIVLTVMAVLAGLDLLSIDKATSQISWTLPGAVAMFVAAGIPAVLINFVIIARGVTILSRLYQWSVQNRP